MSRSIRLLTKLRFVRRSNSSKKSGVRQFSRPFDAAFGKFYAIVDFESTVAVRAFIAANGKDSPFGVGQMIKLLFIANGAGLCKGTIA